MSTGQKNIRVPPQDLDAEKGLLGSILLLNDVLDDVLDIVSAQHFYRPGHTIIFDAILRLRDKEVKGIDAITLSDDLERRGQLEEIGGDRYLAEVLESVPHAAHAKYYAEIIRDKYLQRRLINACKEILEECYSPEDETPKVLQNAEEKIFKILEQQERIESFDLRDILISTFDRINERQSKEGEVSGLTTGFYDLDQLTTGFHPSELVILAARPSMGKTAFVINIAEAVASHTGKGVVLFSLEQSRFEIAERMLCIRAQLDGHKLRRGERLDPEENDRLLLASSQLSELNIFVDDTAGRTMSQMGAICRRLKHRHGLGLVIIDYLQLIEPEDRRAPREQQIALIARRLKFLAKDLSVPVIALAQLNRGVETREDKRPKLADLRESGAIEQDADLVMFLHRPEVYSPEAEPGLAEVIVAKHRSGPIGIIKLTWIARSMKFVDYSVINEPAGGFFGSSDLPQEY